MEPPDVMLPDSDGSTRGLTFAMLAGALAAVGLVVPLTPAANEDLAWLAYAAGQYLDGATIYVDLIELNPPAIVFFNLPATWIAEVTGLPGVATFTMYVALLAAVSVWASCRLLRGAPVLEGADRRLFALLTIVVLFTLAGRNFGQREHLILILVLPYLASAVVRLTEGELGARQAVGVGTLAAVGFSFKPHFLAIWVAVEGLLLWRSRRRRAVLFRPEVVTIVVVLTLYLASVALLTPEYFSLVDVFGDAYLGYLSVPVWEHLSRSAVLFAATSLLGLAVVGVSSRWRSIAPVWAAAVLGCLLGAALQLKAWTYHYYPAFATSMVLLGLLSLRGRGEFGFTPKGVARGACLGVFLFGFLAGLLAIDPIRRESLTRLDRLQSVADRIDARCDQTPRVVVFSPDADAAFPLVTRFGYEWGLRFPTMQLLSAVYEEQAERGEEIRWHDTAAATAAERFTMAAVVEDVTSDPPDLLMVERRDSRRAFGHSGFGYIRYFARNSEFRTLLAEYRLMGHWSGYRVWGHARSEACPRLLSGG